jgi:hypothetical protein
LRKFLNIIEAEFQPKGTNTGVVAYEHVWWDIGDVDGLINILEQWIDLQNKEMAQDGIPADMQIDIEDELKRLLNLSNGSANN